MVISEADRPLLSTAVGDAVAVDLASVVIRETPLRPPTVGNQPLVELILSGLLTLALGESGIVGCVLGDTTVGDAGGLVAVDG